MSRFIDTINKRQVDCQNENKLQVQKIEDAKKLEIAKQKQNAIGLLLAYIKTIEEKILNAVDCDDYEFDFIEKSPLY